MGGIEKDEWGGGSMGDIEKDEWGHWSGSMKRVNGVAGHIEKGQVRRGLGCGSDRGVAVGQTGACLTGF